MITKEQALDPNTRVVHSNTGCYRDGSGCYRYRRNGKTLTWKRDEQRFCFPVKFGLHLYMKITEHNAGDFHVPEECPLNENKDNV